VPATARVTARISRPGCASLSPSRVRAVPPAALPIGHRLSSGMALLGVSSAGPTCCGYVLVAHHILWDTALSSGECVSTDPVVEQLGHAAGRRTTRGASGQAPGDWWRGGAPPEGSLRPAGGVRIDPARLEQRVQELPQSRGAGGAGARPRPSPLHRGRRPGACTHRPAVAPRPPVR